MGLAASKQEAFWEACGFGHIQRVKKFLEDGDIDVNWVSYTHDSCAIHVASQGKTEIVKMLLKANCNVNVRDQYGRLPLHHAAMKGHTEIMELLLKGGSMLDAQDKNDWTPMTMAAYFCQPGAIDVLLKHKCDVHLKNSDGRAPLHEACRSQSKDEEGLGRIATALVQAGSDLNSKSFDLGDADFTPLMFCAYHGHINIAKALIEAGCDLNAQGSNGWSALHWAADRNRVELTRLLLEAGVDPTLQGRRGELCVDRALFNNEIRDLLNRALSESRGGAGEPSISEIEAKLKALNNSIAARSEQNRALLAMVNPPRLEVPVDLDRSRSPVSTMDGSDSDRSLPATPELPHREKADVEPLEKNNKKAINHNKVAPKAEAEEDLFSDESFESPARNSKPKDGPIPNGIISSGVALSDNTASPGKASVGTQVQWRPVDKSPAKKPQLQDAQPTQKVAAQPHIEDEDLDEDIDEAAFADDLIDSPSDQED